MTELEKVNYLQNMSQFFGDFIGIAMVVLVVLIFTLWIFAWWATSSTFIGCQKTKEENNERSDS